MNSLSLLSSHTLFVPQSFSICFQPPGIMNSSLFYLFIYSFDFSSLCVNSVETFISQFHFGNIWQEKLTLEILAVCLKNSQQLLKVITSILFIYFFFFECMGSTLHKFSWVSENSMNAKTVVIQLNGVFFFFWQTGPALFRIEGNYVGIYLWKYNNRWSLKKKKRQCIVFTLVWINS